MPLKKIVITITITIIKSPTFNHIPKTLIITVQKGQNNQMKIF